MKNEEDENRKSEKGEKNEISTTCLISFSLQVPFSALFKNAHCHRLVMHT